MPDIEPQFDDRTRYATGVNNHQPLADRRQIGVCVTVEDFTKVKQEAMRQDVSMGEIIRQLIDLL